MDFKRVRIIACDARPNYILWVRFDDGVEGEVDLSVKIDPESDTVCWGEEIDLDPYTLKQEILESQK